MSGRTYLSIGDVLTLLREEFPDVTISKIRFLESQGLVNPERSPSGYRKFFDHDVERLRWVLRQQREHFLPLKVIRDRLADGELDDEATDVANGKPAEVHEPVHAVAGAGAGAGAGAMVGPPGRVPQIDEQPTKADEDAMARILADASRRAANRPDATQGRRGLQVVDEPGAGAADVSMEPARQHAVMGTPASAPAHGRHEARASEPSMSAASKREPSGPTRPPASRTSAAATGADTASESPPVSGSGRASTKGSAGSPSHGGGGAKTPSPDAASTTGIVTGASLTRDELCSASGLSAEELAGLESFGLVEAVMVAGIATYDEDALTMANLAAAFRAYGIEPRHLRPYRNAVDREVGLIEQVVIPLLRQRNPEARQRAVESAEQLASLGQSMRATLLRQALRRHLGG